MAAILVHRLVTAALIGSLLLTLLDIAVASVFGPMG